jgi:Arc/MetJ-type ribon-helix-helix transcriptional regulator
MVELKHRESEQVSTRLSPNEAQELDKLVEMGFSMNAADFIHSAVREKRTSMEIVTVSDVPLKKAKQEILDDLKTHKTAYPSDIARELGLDLNVVMTAVKELWEQEKIEEAGIQ